MILKFERNKVVQVRTEHVADTETTVQIMEISSDPRASIHPCELTLID